MRLFIAIDFSEEIKDKLSKIIQELKTQSKRGNFTARENLHLTLVFIGESNNVSAVTEAMDRVKAGSFDISVGGLGRFRRDGGDIYWIGVSKNSYLTALYGSLYKELCEKGFKLESREYKPHLTLGREVIVNEDFDKGEFDRKIQKIDSIVNKITLMKSERINGKLTYTPVYEKSLE